MLVIFNFMSSYARINCIYCSENGKIGPVNSCQKYNFLTKQPQYTFQKVTHNTCTCVVLVYVEVKIFVVVNYILYMINELDYKK